MRRVLWLARREYLAAVRTKGFIIALVVAPFLMSASGIVMAIMKDRVDTADLRIAVVDHSGKAAEGIVKAVEDRRDTEVFNEESGKKIRPDYLIEVVEPDSSDLQAQLLALSDRVRSGELDGFVELGPEVFHPGEDPEANRVIFYAKNAAMSDFPGWIDWPLNTYLRRARMTEAGIDTATIQDVITWIGIERKELLTIDETGTIQEAESSNKAVAVLVPIGIMMLMFFMIMMGGGSMLNSVMEEKTQRIAEVLLGSIKPFQFMLGKLLGGISVALTASVFYVIVAAAALTYMGLADHIPVHIIPWFFVYMLLAVLMFGSLFGMLGAWCNEPKDAQNLMFPAMIPIMIPMFVIAPVSKEPLGSFATTMSLIPPFTPTLMIARLATPSDIPMWQPWVGLLGVITLTALAVWAGGRIFRVGILMQGKPARLTDFVKWAVRG